MQVKYRNHSSEMVVGLVGIFYLRKCDHLKRDEEVYTVECAEAAVNKSSHGFLQVILTWCVCAILS